MRRAIKAILRPLWRLFCAGLDPFGRRLRRYFLADLERSLAEVHARVDQTLAEAHAKLDQALAELKKPPPSLAAVEDMAAAAEAALLTLAAFRESDSTEPSAETIATGKESRSRCASSGSL